MQSLEALLASAEESAPRLLVARARWDASRERAAQAVELPDPMLRLTWWAEEIQTRSGPMDARIMASQRFPWPGKLDAAGAVAEAGSLASGAALQAARAELRLQITESWNRRVHAARAEDILAAHAELLDEIGGIARVAAERAGARPLGLMRVQVDLGRTRDRISELQEQGLQTHAMLETLAGAALEVERDWAAEAFAPTAAGDDGDGAQSGAGAAQRQVPEAHPLLRLHDARVRMAQQGIEVAGLAGRPDFEVALDYTFVGDAGAPGVESGADPVSLSLGFSLPFGSTADDAREAEARAELGARRAEARGARLQLDGRLRSVAAAARDAARRAGLYREELLPQAQEAFAISLDGYQAGQAPFLEVLETARDLLRLRLDALEAERDAADARAETDYLTASSAGPAATGMETER